MEITATPIAPLTHDTEGPTREGCPMGPLLEMLTQPWTLHILWTLSTRGPQRFGSLRRSVTGISARLLTVRLRTLEAKGLVHRSATGTKLQQVTYSPTSRLSDMEKVLSELHRVHDKWDQENDAAITPTPRPTNPHIPN